MARTVVTVVVALALLLSVSVGSPGCDTGKKLCAYIQANRQAYDLGLQILVILVGSSLPPTTVTLVEVAGWFVGTACDLYEGKEYKFEVIYSVPAERLVSADLSEPVEIRDAITAKITSGFRREVHISTAPESAAEAMFRAQGQQLSDAIIIVEILESTPTPTAMPTRTATTTATATSTKTPTATATPCPGIVTMRLAPTTPMVAVGEIFTMDIMFDASTQQVDGAEAHLDFNPAYVQVVNALGTPVSAIEADTTSLSMVLLNTVDNNLGQIDYAAGKLSSPFPSGTFRIATIRFKALANNMGLPVVFVYDISNNRITDVTFSGVSVFCGATDGLVVIGPTPTATFNVTSTFTATPTPTSTPMPYKMYLPVIYDMYLPGW